MNKQEMAGCLLELPSDIAEKAYSIELIDKKVTLQWDSFLADKYAEYAKVKANKAFIWFKVNGWKVSMETENYLHPVMAGILKDFKKGV